MKIIKGLYGESAKARLARLRWVLNCIIVSGKVLIKVKCIMEIDVIGADMLSHIKADYGRHDFL